MPERDEGAWVEAIALFQSAREGEYEVAAQLLRTTANPETVALSLLRMLGVYLRGEDPKNLDRFIDASYRAGPPPAPGTAPPGCLQCPNASPGYFYKEWAVGYERAGTPPPKAPPIRFRLSATGSWHARFSGVARTHWSLIKEPLPCPTRKSSRKFSDALKDDNAHSLRAIQAHP